MSRSASARSAPAAAAPATHTPRGRAVTTARHARPVSMDEGRTCGFVRSSQPPIRPTRSYARRAGHARPTKGDPMLQRLTLLALIVTLLAPAAAGARAPHKHLSSPKHLSSLSVARGRHAITRYMARGDEGTVGACEAIDPLRVSCVTTEYEPESEEEIQW